MAQLRDKNGKFVRTTPDYKELYEGQRRANIALNNDLISMKEQREHFKKLWVEAESKISAHKSEVDLIKEAYLDAVAHMGWVRRKLFGFDGHVS